MSSFQYYQQQPLWGTQQYQLAPPRPYFQPQQGWNGRNFFNAQAGLGDGYDDWDDDFGVRQEGFFDGVFRGIKDMFSRGMSREEAKYWHRQVYTGLAPVDTLDAPQLGGAAGYEAIRHWMTYRSTYQQSFSDDRHREREALAGLAAGEAVKLLNYSQVPRRRRARREAAEIAAATAERVFAEDIDDPYSSYDSGSYGRRRRSIGEAPGFRRRRSSSFGAGMAGGAGLGVPGARPIVSHSTGGTFVSAQPTGASYLSAQPTGLSYQQQQPTGVSYVSASPPTGYGQQILGAQQAQFMTATGQPMQGIQYAQSGVQYAQPGYAGGGVQYAQPGYTGGGVQYVQQQPQVMGGYPGQQVAYTTAGQPVQYVQQGYPAGAQMVYPGQQPQFLATGGAPYRSRAQSFGGGGVY